MHRFLALLICVLAAATAGAEDAPPPAFPLPANTPGVMVVDLEKFFVEYNPARDNNDPNVQLGILPLMALEKAAADDERRVSLLREPVMAAGLAAQYRQVILDNISQMAPAANVVVSEKRWTPEEAFANTRGSDGLYFELRPFHGFQLRLEGVGAWLTVQVLRVEQRSSGKFRITPLRAFQLAFLHGFGHRRTAGATATSRMWMAMPPERVTEWIRDSIGQVGQMLAYQLSPEGLAELEQKVEGKIEFRGIRLKARKVREGEGWYWMRVGPTSWLQGEHPIPDSEIPAPLPADDPRVMQIERRQ